MKFREKGHINNGLKRRKKDKVQKKRFHGHFSLLYREKKRKKISENMGVLFAKLRQGGGAAILKLSHRDRI